MHRKCAEQRPSCEHCLSAGKECSYNKDLKWGGRSFRKSCFGQVLSTGAVVVQSGRPANAGEKGTCSILARELILPDLVSSLGPFVYGPGKKTTSASSRQSQTLPSDDLSILETTNEQTPGRDDDETPENDQSLSLGDDNDDASILPAVPDRNHLPQTPDWLPWLSKVDRRLLNHFTVTVTRYMSLHQTMQDDFCSIMLPMALDTSHGTHLLSALLGVAAIHQSTAGSFDDSTYLARLRCNSLQRLSLQEVGQNAAVDEQSIATALTLCMGDILSGGEKPQSWRLHLRGAAAMMSSYLSDHPPESGNILFLWRWWKSLEISAVLSGRPSTMLDRKTNLPLLQSSGSDYIDIFDGFSTKLLPVIEEVDMLNAERQAFQDLELRCGPADPALTMLRLSHLARCNAVAAKINVMMDSPMADPISDQAPSPGLDRDRDQDQDTDSNLRSPDNLDPSSDFRQLNETYHLAVLLQLYQMVMNKPVTDAAVRQAVRRGVQCMRQITLYDCASPGVATLQPAFIFGCAAHDPEDRLFVKGWLDRMSQSYSLGNTNSARAFVEELWVRRDDMGDAGARLQWHELLGMLIYRTYSPSRGVTADSRVAEKDWDLSLF